MQLQGNVLNIPMIFELRKTLSHTNIEKYALVKSCIRLETNFLHNYKWSWVG